MMDDISIIKQMIKIPVFEDIFKKITINPKELNNQEITYILTCAILLIKEYETDHRHTSLLELAYYIILKYSLSFNDYGPLYDFSINIGFYPISQVITNHKLIEISSITTSLLESNINAKYKRNDIIETIEQKLTFERVTLSKEKEVCFIAPTSFGKSSIILEHIQNNLNVVNNFAIIVPTKSLLMQTYRNIKKKFHNKIKILLHDEMYSNETKFIAVLTQERALRLLDKYNISFDILYVDEAHKLFELDSRSILLLRLIKLNNMRNKNSRTLYFSPLISDVNNLNIQDDQHIYEQRIKFNVKIPEYYEYLKTGEVFKYNVFVNNNFQINSCKNMFDYIKTYHSSKTFCYLTAPKKIEQFSNELAKHFDYIPMTDNLEELIYILETYVHKDFYVIEYLKKGIIYIHGKMPDNIKEYLAYKFSQLPEIKFLIANNVILEGINLPIDSLFILSGENLHYKELVNLIGRVNRLDYVFGAENNLNKLIPKIHFVNNDEYNRKNGNLKNKIKLVQKKVFSDEIDNPLLKNFKMKEKNEDKNKQEKYNTIVSDDICFFSKQISEVQILKQKIIALNISSIYKPADNFYELILNQINTLKYNKEMKKMHVFDRLYYIFINMLEKYIIDDEFKRLKNKEAITYYKMYFLNRKKTLKEHVTSEVKYFEKRIQNGNSLLYIGKSFGEVPYENLNNKKNKNNKNVYIDLSKKNKKQMVNIAVVKQKIEDDFVNNKLQKFFQLMYDYNLLTLDEYNEIVYGTNDKEKLYLIKMGLTINIINDLESAGQLTNVKVDVNGNLYTEKDFEDYRKNLDDYLKFELSRLL